MEERFGLVVIGFYKELGKKGGWNASMRFALGIGIPGENRRDPCKFETCEIVIAQVSRAKTADRKSVV